MYEDLKVTNFTNYFEDDGILLKGEISLNNLYFSYPNSSRYSLNNINLGIPVKSKVGLIGKTGSGKTTIVDILLGYWNLVKAP